MDSAQRSQLGPMSARTILMASARLLWRISANRRLRLPIGAGRSAVAAIVVHFLVTVLLNDYITNLTPRTLPVRQTTSQVHR